MLSAPVICHAQADEMDNQDPSRYTDEDSQLLNLMSYPLRPVGWVLEWTVARPLHYLATSSSIAPVFGADAEKEDAALAHQVRELPAPDTISAAGDQPVDTEIAPAAVRANQISASQPSPVQSQPVSISGHQPAPPGTVAPSGSVPQPNLQH